MPKKIYAAAILTGIILGIFLLPEMSEEQPLSDEHKMVRERDTLLDSIVVNDKLLVLTARKSNLSSLCLKIYETSNQQLEENFPRKYFYGKNYSGIDIIDYNNDGYQDICIRVSGREKYGIKETSNFQIFLYNPSSNKFVEFASRLHHREILGHKGMEYRVGKDCFASAPHYELYDVFNKKYVWQSYLWKVNGVKLDVLAHIEWRENQLYYYNGYSGYPKDSMKVNLEQKGVNNIEGLDNMFRKYWESNIEQLIIRNFE